MSKVLFCLLLGALGAPAAHAAEEPPETLLLQQPAVSAEHVVFAYARDLWVADRSGGTARRLTSGEGMETGPRISPDGAWVAFTAEYQGNADVYVMPIHGGTPRRLTFHPDYDIVRGWSPDGSKVLFLSWRQGAPPVGRLLLVSPEGGPPEMLPIPRAYHAAIRADGKRIAYTPYSDAFRTWKRYRGGRTTPIWVYDPATHDVDVVPRVNASDTQPAWLGDTLYFLSDRSEQMNLYRLSADGATVEALTTFPRDGYGIRSLTAGPDVLAYTRAGAIHLYDPAAGTTKRLRIHVPNDDLHRRERWQTAGRHIRDGGIAPNGKRAVFEVRGEIVTVPREFGAPRVISNSPGAHDRGPRWSPDGRQIAWFSDRDGEYELVVGSHDGQGTEVRYALDGAGFYLDLVWSPNGEKILFGDKANRLAVLDVTSGKVTEVAKTQGSLGMWRPFGVWSPDSRWIAYETKNASTSYGGVALHELGTDRHISLTDGFSSADSPAFSKDGKLLFFSASVNSGPKQFGLDMSTSAARATSGSLYLAVLAADGEDPLGPRSDEGYDDPDEGKDKKKNEYREPDNGKDGDEDDKPDSDEEDDDKKEDDKKEDDKKEDDDDKDDPDEGGDADEKKDADDEDGDDKEAADGDDDDGDKKDDGDKDDVPETKVDAEGLDQRILALPVDRGQFYGLGTTAKGALLFVQRPVGGKTKLRRFDFKKRKATDVAEGVTGYNLSYDGKHLLAQKGSSWSIANEMGKEAKGVKPGSIRLHIDPRLEWPQILREVWRIQRDFFYDVEMHGVDWDAAWERWQVFLPHVRHRSDLNVLIGEMIGELACGHQYVDGGETNEDPDGPSVGLLGCDFEIEGKRFKVARILRGQNWNPAMRAPLTAPGVHVREGDLLLRVNGQEVTTDRNIFEVFLETAGRPTEIDVSDKVQGGDVRTSTVLPLESERQLRRLAWVEANRKRVDELSDGRLAYIYMPNTGGRGMAAFDRDYSSQLDKQGLVLDERFNGGGKVADYVVNTLANPVLCYWRNREGWVARTPFGTMRGPKVMIANERAGSGGDALPWMFKRLKLGPVVGTRTWGGLVGISGYPPLMDGGSITAASFGIVDTDGSWIVENVGVAPDVEVVQWPKEVIAGRDPQLETAVALALEMLEKNPPQGDPKIGAPTPR